MGFTAKGVKGGIDAIGKIPLPAIAHVVVQEQLHHYIVIYKVEKNTITAMDPAFGKLENYTLKNSKKFGQEF